MISLLDRNRFFRNQTNVTFAALHIASAPSIAATKPLVSTNLKLHHDIQILSEIGFIIQIFYFVFFIVLI